MHECPWCGESCDCMCVDREECDHCAFDDDTDLAAESEPAADGPLGEWWEE